MNHIPIEFLIITNSRIPLQCGQRRRQQRTETPVTARMVESRTEAVIMARLSDVWSDVPSSMYLALIRLLSEPSPLDIQMLCVPYWR